MGSIKIFLSGIFQAIKICLKTIAAALLLLSIFANFSIAVASTLSSIGSAVGITTVASALSQSISAKNKQIEKTKAKLAQTNKQLKSTKTSLDESKAKLSKTETQLKSTRNALAEKSSKLSKTEAQLKSAKVSIDQHKSQLSKVTKSVQSGSEKIIKRTKRIVTRNIVAIPTEVVPFIGIPTVIGLTTWEVFESCKTIEELNYLREVIGIDRSNDDASKFCSDAEKKIESAVQKADKVKKKWEKWEKWFSARFD